MIETNIIAFDEDYKIMSSYVIEGIQEQDVAKQFPRMTNGMYEFIADRIFLKDLYNLMTIRVSTAEKYDVRLKKTIVEKALMEYGDNFMDDVLYWKTKLNFNPRDLMLEYKFMTECQTIANLINFFKENEEYRFGFLFAKSYE